MKEGNEYQYRVIANNEAGPSDHSLPSKTAIAKPMRGKNVRTSSDDESLW